MSETLPRCIWNASGGKGALIVRALFVLQRAYSANDNLSLR